jgi:peptidoglycan-associated lipoprotein
MRRRLFDHSAILVLLFLLILSVYGCAGRKSAPGGQAFPPPSATGTSEVREEAVTPETGIGEEQLGETGREKVSGEQRRQDTALQPIFFDYDQYDLTAEAITILNETEKFLAKNPAVAVRIEGNCDERGTPEYNLALGERRATIARQYLVNLGISADRITTISYGEEAPLDAGHDEGAWAKNRRDDFRIVTQ